MKLNFSVTVDQYDDIDTLQNEFIDMAANKFLEQLLGDHWDRTDLYTKLEKRVVDKLEHIMDADFKNSVATKVTENLANKFEKTKQYKVLKADGEVVADSVIKSGLRDIIADVVKSEMKKMFK